MYSWKTLLQKLFNTARLVSGIRLIDVHTKLNASSRTENARARSTSRTGGGGAEWSDIIRTNR